MSVEIGRIRKGMEVRASDGDVLGRVAEVWVGTDPGSTQPRCDEEVCSRLEVRRRERLVREVVLYVPYSAIAGVSDEGVALGVDGEAARSSGWSHRPRWIRDEGARIHPTAF